jgi:hypothetical protein
MMPCYKTLFFKKISEKIRLLVSGFQKKPFYLRSLSVGRASVPAQVSPRQQPLFLWLEGDFYNNCIYQENKVSSSEFREGFRFPVSGKNLFI